MRFPVYIFIAFVLASCSSVKEVSEIKSALDASRMEVLKSEKVLSDQFVSVRIFHQGLMAVVGDKSQIPYGSLDSIFQSAYLRTNDALMSRMLADAGYEYLFTEIGKKEKVRITPKMKQQIASVDSGYVVSNIQLMEAAMVMHQDSMSYAALCSQYHISRDDHFEVLEKMGKRLYQFQDSLEMQGFKLSACKRHLQSTGLKLGMPDFQPHYKLVSELELMLKQYQQLLIQLENSFARFESGNPEELYYTGPFIIPRVDITIYNELLSELTIEMQRFRELEKSYYDSYTTP
ncbi:MAG: hypothetical protein ACOVOO_00115 [Flavobacteriales bacterium]